MYRPAQFREDRHDVLAATIGDIQFATLVTLSLDQQLTASHIPMLFKREGNVMRLEGHIARPNPQWTQLDAKVDALAVFVGPQSYISPTWYAAKAEHQRVVPTWNYVSVHASGPLTIIDDKTWLLRHVEELTNHNEAVRPQPWSVHDAPADFIGQLCGGIIGLSMEIRHMEGAWKMAQHRSQADREGVITNLIKEPDAQSQAVACEMQRLEMERRKPE